MGVRGAAAYKKVGTQTGAEFASPHRLIQMLLEGALEKMILARGHIERKNLSGRAENINWAIRIIGGLQASIDSDKGGEVAETLSSLYVFLVSKLSEANRTNDKKMVDECIAIINNIKDGWEGIRDEADKIHKDQQAASE